MMVATARKQRVEYIAPFNVSGVNWDARGAMLDKTKIVLLTGSKGGGKSRLAGEKIHAFCLRYPGAMGLIVRKAREFMSNGTVPFMQTKVIGADPRVTWNGSVHRWNYENGSMLATGGMLDAKQREAVRSIGQDGALDIIWVEEANSITWEDFQELVGCLRGKAASWVQIILTCNPDGPLHWINQNLILGGMAHVYLSSAADNPNNPPGYVENTLNILTGVMRERLVLGRWVQAEGVIYDNFSVAKNVCEIEYDPNQPIVWGVDDGYAKGEGPGKLSYHPRVFLVAQEDGRGGFNILAERYSTGEASYDTSIDAVLELGFPAPQIAYIDSSAAMLRGALTVRGIPNMGATHPVVDGLRNVRRLICDGNQQTLLRIHPRCTELITEMQMYSYDETAQVAGDRKPLKANDHGCLVAGTLITTFEGDKPIENVRIGDYVLTRSGYHKVLASEITNPNALVYEVRFSNGNSLVGTADHPVWSSYSGFVPLCELQQGDTVHRTAQHVVVLSVRKLDNPQAVYNLTVDTVGEYFANGILVHNCDALRYMTWHARYNT